MPNSTIPIPEEASANALTVYECSFGDGTMNYGDDTLHSSLEGARAVATAWLRQEVGPDKALVVTRPWDGMYEEIKEAGVEFFPQVVLIRGRPLYP